ncbi:T9SS type A sorting domain-containing protein [Psychroserpens sp.]|uniref:T9SS type A sorting domain-containing protein n=1 Tax=Psychroserpens sp. TaxID=2020870 RepID=UPI002B274D5D|nr:T9SS type A sorting domain-containing protein [Psychroserpens sp.]
MKLNYIPLIILFFNFTCFAQGFEWVKHIEGTGTKNITHSVMDDSDNLYVAGYFDGETDFDPTGNDNSINANGAYYAFLTQYNSSGDLQWVKAIETSSFVVINKLLIVNNGIYVAGYFRESADFDSGTTVLTASLSSGSKMFLAFYDLDGNFQWVEGWTNSSAKTTPQDLVVDSEGNLHITGNYYEGLFRPDPNNNAVVYSSTRQKGFWITLDSSSNYMRSNQFGDPANTWYNYDSVDNIIMNGTNHVLISGRFRGSFDFDFDSGTSVLENENGASFFAKYLLDGTLVWVKQLERVESQHLICDSEGNIFATGIYGGNVDFDPSDTSEYIVEGFGSYYDNYLFKWNNNGEFNWAFGFGSNYGPADSSNAIALDGDSVYITGGITYANEVDFDPDPNETFGITANGISDYFCARYTTEGDFIWVHSLSGDQALTSDVSGKGIMINSMGKVYSVGEFSDTVDFNSGSELITAQGYKDIFLMRLDNEVLGIQEESLENSLNIYPNPVSNDLFIKAKSVLQNLNIYNIEGQLIYSAYLNNYKSEIDLSHLTTGVYLLKVYAKDGLTMTRRLIKK